MEDDGKIFPFSNIGFIYAVCVCMSAGASEGVLLQVQKQHHIIFFSLIQP